MSGNQLPKLLREALDDALRTLRPFSPPPQSEHYAEYQHALVQLENSSICLHAVGMGAHADQALNISAVQDLIAGMRSSAPHA